MAHEDALGEGMAGLETQAHTESGEQAQMFILVAGFVGAMSCNA